MAKSYKKSVTGPLDIVRKAAYGEEGPQFDYDKALRKFTPQMLGKEEIAIFADMDSHGVGRAWETDIGQLCSTQQWLKKYSLKHYRLDMDCILGAIGFRHSTDYEKMVKKPVCSRYADGLFARFTTAEGKSYNVIATRDKLQQFEKRLNNIIGLYSRRLEWLTTESRRTFGVVTEQNVCVVLNLCTSNESLFTHYLAIVRAVLRQQISEKNRLNLIRASDIVDSWRPCAVPVTKDALEAAVSWLDTLDSGSLSSATAVAEAILKAGGDRKTDAIYLFTGGYDPVSAREILLQQARLINVPVHVVAFNVFDENTLYFLRELASTSRGRFHAYTINWCVEDFDVNPALLCSQRPTPEAIHNPIVSKRYLYGGVPPGAGIREDVFRLYEEIETARNNLTIVQTILQDLPESQLAQQAIEKQRARAARMAKADTIFQSETAEEYMSSREWLLKYGLRQRKLDLYDVLAGVAFRHCDGVVDVASNPGVGTSQTDAVVHQKLINARYCNKFAHLRWRDGSLVHVQVTGETHRAFTEALKVAVDAIQKRINWLKSGSRELFGSILENQVYIVIDVSCSMAPSLKFVKDKIFQLMQEQLRHKTKFNIVAFNTKVYAWKTRLAPICEETLRNAWQWLRQIECTGSTNTMAALDYAMGDPETEAVYLLTDGRPDQPGSAVLAQATHRRILPVHTISFNCHDAEANQFLAELARVTNGRFHAFSSSGDIIIDPFSEEPEAWESEDVKVLRRELAVAREYSETMSQLRKECLALAWKKDTPQPRGGRDSYSPAVVGAMLSARDRFDYGGGVASATPSFLDRPLPRSQTAAPSYAFKPQPDRMVVLAKRPKSRPNIARHTKTSILRLVRDDRSPSPPRRSPLVLGLRPAYLDSDNNVIEPSTDEEKVTKKEVLKKRSSSAGPKKVKVNSVKRWLANHSLAAKHLTAVDVLTPLMLAMHRKISTTITSARSPRPGHEFDDLTKIMEEVAPTLSHRYVPDDEDEGIDFKSLRESLKHYEIDVARTYAKIEKHLSRLVWQAIDDKDKRQINPLKPLEPVPFNRYRSELIAALDRAGWKRISEADVALLEKEMEAANNYLKHSRNFQLWLSGHEGDRGDAIADALTPKDDGKKNKKKKRRPKSAALVGTPVARRARDMYADVLVAEVESYSESSDTSSSSSSSSSSRR